jgi:hypothetical protein
VRATNGIPKPGAGAIRRGGQNGQTPGVNDPVILTLDNRDEFIGGAGISTS